MVKIQGVFRLWEVNDYLTSTHLRLLTMTVPPLLPHNHSLSFVSVSPPSSAVFSQGFLQTSKFPQNSGGKLLSASDRMRRLSHK